MSGKRNDDYGITVYSPLHKALNYILLTITSLIILSPILVVLNIAFKTDQEYLETAFYELPDSLLYLDNFITVFRDGDLLLAFSNTFILIVVSVFFNIAMGTMTAYVLGRFQFPLKKFLLGAFILASIIPWVVTQVATFTIIQNLGIFNTIFAGMVLYMATNVLQIYIFLQFMDNIPLELDESALIDGASYLKIYFSIILPLMKPAIATVCILSTIHIYNDMLTPYLYMPKTSLKTVTTALMKFSYDRNSNWTVMGAGIITVMIPTLVMYLGLQKFILAGITDGAIKA